MAENGAALLEQIDALEQGAKEDKRLAAHHRRALATKLERLKALKARCAAMGIRLIVQERTDGPSDTHAAADFSIGDHAVVHRRAR